MAAQKPVEYSPPAGTPWEEVEKERVRLGWSARKLSRAAGLNPTHYGTIAARNGWATTELETLNRFRSALGLLITRINLPISAISDGPGDSLLRGQFRKRAIEILVREGKDLDEATEAVDQLRGFEPARGPGQSDPDPERLAHFARALLDAKGKLGAPPTPDLGLDTPVGKAKKRR